MLFGISPPKFGLKLSDVIGGISKYIAKAQEEQQMANQLSDHFTLEEMTTTSYDVKNVPNETELAYLRRLCVMMEQLREKFGPIQVNSAFRCRELEEIISGKAYGQHMLGQACDWVPVDADLKLRDIASEILKLDLPFDQLIIERPAKERRGWIHISIAPDGKQPRKQPLMYGFWTIDELGKMRYRDLDVNSIPL